MCAVFLEEYNIKHFNPIGKYKSSYRRECAYTQPGMLVKKKKRGKKNKISERIVVKGLCVCGVAHNQETCRALTDPAPEPLPGGAAAWTPFVSAGRCASELRQVITSARARVPGPGSAGTGHHQINTSSVMDRPRRHSGSIPAHCERERERERGYRWIAVDRNQWRWVDRGR